MLLLLIACAPSPALSAPEPAVGAATAREVSISATARLNVAPDEALIDLDFAATAAGMRRAHDASKQATDTFTAAIRALDLPEKSLELGGTTDTANRRWDGSERIISYSSTTALAVHLADFERVAEVVDLAVGSGATDIRVSYRSTNLPERKKEAREMAISAAKAKAEQLASGMGARLGPVLRISEDNNTGRYGMYSGAGNAVQNEARDEPAEGGPAAPGTVPLELTIQAVFALE